MIRTLVIDGTNLGVQAWYAHSANRNGIPVSANGRPIAGCSAVLKRLAGLIKDYAIDEIAVVFDNGSTCFRHDLYPPYKQNRGAKAESMVADVANLVEAMTLMGIAVVAPPGFEADDAIGAIATQAVQAGKQVFVCSGDWDLSQLVGDNCLFLCKKNSSVLEVREADVLKRFGVLPRSVPDHKALVGDSTDNFPGVNKIGPVIAVELLSKYPSVEEIYANIRQITGKPYTLLRATNAQRDAFLFKRIAALDLNVPLPEQDFRVSRINLEAVTPLLREFGLTSRLSAYQPLCA